MMKRRYERNMMTLSPEENGRLKGFKVCVVGCGGLGGYVIEYLGRLGIGQITAVDGDVFDETNLNRQILCEEPLVGAGKAEAARARMDRVNSEIAVNPVHAFLTEENCKEIIAGHDAVVDALDNIHTRLMLEKECQHLGIPLVHGAIGGWYGQVSVILPGKPLLEKLYPQKPGAADKGMEAELGNPSFTPAMIAAVQAAETVKLLLGREGVLAGKLLTVDLLYQEYEVFEMG